MGSVQYMNDKRIVMLSCVCILHRPFLMFQEGMVPMAFWHTWLEHLGSVGEICKIVCLCEN